MGRSHLTNFASSASRLIATSAQLAKKQAELATLNNVTLPKLHYSIGKRIARLPTLPPELVPFRDGIMKLESEIAATPASEHPARPEDQRLAARAKQLAQQVARKASKAASDASATVRIQAAYVALGKEAVSRYGEKAVPKELQADLLAAQQQGKALAEEIAEMQAKNSVGWLTPRRFVLGSASVLILFFGAFVLRSIGGVSNRSTQSTHEQTVDRPTTVADVTQQEAHSSASSRIPNPMTSNSQARLSHFESECDKICSQMMAGYRLAGTPRDIVVSCGEKLEEIGADPSKRMEGLGISAGCAKATITYLGSCGLFSLEAAARCIGQDLPDGGLVAMMDSDAAKTLRRLSAAGNAGEYWTYMAFMRAFIQLSAESNGFNADYERQLLQGGAQPVVISELQQMRQDLHARLARHYATGVDEGLRQYGPPSYP